jgi:hypothetical protein
LGVSNVVDIVVYVLALNLQDLSTGKALPVEAELGKVVGITRLQMISDNA